MPVRPRIPESDPLYTAGGATDAELAAATAAAAAALAAHAAGDATDVELAAAVATLNAAIDALPTGGEVDASIAAAVAAHAAGDASDAELAAAVASLTASIALKQDAATAATDAELSAAVAAHESAGAHAETLLAGGLGLYLPAPSFRALGDEEAVWIPAASLADMTFGGGGHTWSTVTDDNVLGDSSLQVSTAFGTKANATMDAGDSAAGVTLPVDLTGKYLRVWVKVDDPAVFSTLTLLAGNSGLSSFWTWKLSEAYGTDPSWLKPNEWTCIDLPFGEQDTTGSPDRDNIGAIRLAAQDDGVSHVTVKWGGIVAVPEPVRGVVSLTFDDGRVTQFTEAREALARHGFKGTFYLMPGKVEAATGVNDMTEAMVQKMHELGHEMAAHCWDSDSHNLADGLNELTEAQLELEMLRVKHWLLRRGYRGADQMAYPKGRHNTTVHRVMRKYFQSARTTVANTDNSESLYAPAPYHLQVRNANGLTTAAGTEPYITKAIDNKSWLILVFHTIGTGDIPIVEFEGILQDIADSGVAVRTVGEVMRGDI